MKFGHLFTTIGCGVLMIASGIAFLSIITSPPGTTTMTTFVWWLVLTAVGALVLALVEALLVWRDLNEAKRATEAILAHAEELRRQRGRQRGEPQAPEPAAEAEQQQARPVVTIPEAEIPSDVVPTVEPDEQAPPILRLPVKRAEQDLAQCPVCQTRIVEGELYVTCPGCGTEHHADCWEYNQGCGVFGCPW